MSKLNEQSKWEESINQVEDSDRVKGGESGAVNIQAGQLAARTQYLRNLFDSLMVTINLGEGWYKTLSDAQRDIDNGKLPADALFNVRSTDDKHWVDEYQNVNGLATPTGRFLASGNYLAEILTQLVSTMLTVGTLENRIKSIKSYHSDKYPIIFNAEGGPDETYGAFDNQSGLWLGGLEAAVQDYLLSILPKNKTNRYPGLAYFFAAENGDDSYGIIEKNGAWRLPWMDDVLQERLDGLLSTKITRRIQGWHSLLVSKDADPRIIYGLRAADAGLILTGLGTTAVQDYISANIRPAEGKLALHIGEQLLWNDHPVMSAHNLGPDAVLFSYLPAGESAPRYAVMFIKSKREMVPGGEMHITTEDGQSLAASFDSHNGSNINIMNYDPRYRGYALALANGRPEGGNLKAVTDDDRDTANDLQYPAAGWRQGHSLPRTYTLLDKLAENGQTWPVFFHAPAAAGGQSFANISPGTVPYQNGIDMVTRAKQIADAVGKKCRVVVLLFEHGETDNDNGDNLLPGDYLAKEEIYFPRRIADYKAITGQTDEIVIVIGQVGSRLNSKAQAVDEEGNPLGEEVITQPYSISAVDQREYVRRHANAICYGPKYPLNWLYSDGSLSHINAAGKVLQGEYQAQAVHWHLYDDKKKGTWTDTTIESVTVTGSVIEARCKMPYPPLVIDNAFIGDVKNQGLSLELKSAAILSVDVVDGTTLRITCDKAPAANDYLLVGFNNKTQHANGQTYPLTCLRDSSPMVSKKITRNGAPFPLYNWMTLDRIPLSGEKA
ncbi:hypothetical protein DMW52_04340 [Serratia marcescens]|uniref:hypothetical protein n=1 Tax=Serratia marcescens TaxID=615 RepID=UPI000DA07C65|nr:hypothetical protein [Serratia marcescens]PYA61920.1 hypothetical protein DMW52_04340 [Serratia marcescens]